MQQIVEDGATLLTLASFVVQVVAAAAFFSLFFGLVTSSNQQTPRARYQVATVSRKREKTITDPAQRRAKSKARRPHSQAPGVHARSRRLPQELVDEIIDYLRGDKASLSACALTCHAWLPRARVYLHQTLVIRKGGNDPYKLRFYPGVFAAVRRVIVRGSLGTEIAHSVLAGRPEVEVLELEADPDVNTRACVITDGEDFPRFSMLRTLKLRGVYFGTNQQMFRALARLRYLSELSVDLSDLYYAFIHPEERTPAIHVQIPVERLHMRIRYTAVPMNRVPRSRVLLQAAGRTLKHLSLNVLTYGQQTAFVAVDHLDLASNTSLTSLSLTFTWMIDPSPPQSYSRLASTLLSRIHSSQLSSLTFNILVPANTDTRLPHRYQHGIIAQGIGPATYDLDLRLFDTFADPIVDGSMVSATADRIRAHATNLRRVIIRLAFENMAPKATQLDADTRVRKGKWHRVGDGGDIGRQLETIVRSQLPALTAKGILAVEWTALASNTSDVFAQFE